MLKSIHLVPFAVVATREWTSSAKSFLPSISVACGRAQRGHVIWSNDLNGATIQRDYYY